MKQITFLRHGDILSGYSWKQLENINMLQDTVSLSALGIQQVTNYSKTLHSTDFDIIITADSLRTRETAQIISQQINKPIIIEPLLNAWKPSKRKKFLSFNDYWSAYEQFILCNGIPCKKKVDWETYDELHSRTLKGIIKYENFDSILIVSHSIIISLYTGISRKGIPYCSPHLVDYAKLKCSPPDFKAIL